MKERERYVIVVNGKPIDVTPEVYEAYYKAERKERHFMEDLKQGRSRIDKATGEKYYMPSLEDSYDRLIDENFQFEDYRQNIEEEVLLKLMLTRLNEALERLNFEEAEIIRHLYYERVTEVKLAEMLGMPRRTLRDKKKRILDKLRRWIE